MHNIHIKTIGADRFTPYIVFKKLNALALLESVILEQGKSRYSIVLVEEAFRLTLTNAGVCLENKGENKILSKNPADYLNLLKKISQEINLKTSNLEIPLPVRGIGFLGFELAKYFDEINFATQTKIIDIPQAVFSFGAVFIVFDHYKDELHIIAVGNEESEVKLIEKTNKIVFRLLDNDFRAYQNDEQKYTYRIGFDTSKEDFTNGVLQLKKEIVKGNLLQGVISRLVEIKSDIPPLEAYRRLRRENPSPYLFYLNFNSFTLFGASPETMVQLKNNAALLKPIAGTRPRGKTLTEDLALEKELLADAKERAEHLMLVDLGRNDLSRTAKKGSVKLTRPFSIERYSQVMHIVSEIESEMDVGQDAYSLIASTFPAGTVSGAPKIKAIETLSNIEKTDRGPYAGLVGYFDHQGNFDSCITIRSAVHKDGSYFIQSGAGIVYDSDPEKEYQETIHKAKAMIKALGVSE